ncbi:MAG: hypothetical protein CVV44_11055 [Spirochaetae bacterium HGW-Spirochaetae-1]|jgi:uncharacterized membrane protein|nr:MAG: hypothetical protein CVV44_11055 [Spirochaetae bacterium HGW-Spirochaetae-1]
MKVHKKTTSALCQVTGKELSEDMLVPANSIRLPILELIRTDHPDFDENGFICIDELNRYRQKYLNELVISERGEVTELEREVLETMKQADFLSRNINIEEEEKFTTGQHVADIVARFGGSWTFIISFFVILAAWIITNVFLLGARPFDPYPFILLNLILSCMASIQAPIIMMSQNRQEAKDRLRSEHDYQINLKSELEIRQLHEKIDHLVSRQMHKLFEIQELQVDYLQELLSIAENKKNDRGDAG